MIRASIIPPGRSFVDAYKKGCIQRLESAALDATDQVAREALKDVRVEMAGAGLGRLGNAYSYGSDKRSGNGVKRRGPEAFSASAWIYVRSKSERAHGAILAYTRGAQIRPVKGAWLWFATENAPKRAGRFKMTPALYNRSGYAQSIGPLVRIPGRDKREALLVVNNVTVRSVGSASPRRVPARGAIRGGRERAENVVMFIGIKRTSREARVDPPAVMRRRAATIGKYLRTSVV